MAQLLNEIQWGEPLLPPVIDPAWEAETKRRGGRTSELDRRVVSSPWLREACLAVTTYRTSQIPERLANIGGLVTAQENSCRYCYGATRAYMKMTGYSESFISRIERDAQMAELDEKQRGFILFCRNLARSMPRPAKADRDRLIRLGFAPLAVNEMAFHIATGCFYNRLGVLLACPPELEFERFANGFIGRLFAVAGSIKRALPARKRPEQPEGEATAAPIPRGPFGAITATLTGLPQPTWFEAALEGAFASPVLPRRAKAFMFAVVARSLDCRYCENEACGVLEGDGFAKPEIDAALAALASKRLEPFESKLLSWVRGTVHYQTGAIQNETRALAAEIGAAAVLEAIGVAALANMAVRLAMLLE